MERASEAGNALDEKRVTPPNIEARPSARGAQSQSYTLQAYSEVDIGDTSEFKNFFKNAAEFKTITITIHITN